MKNDRPLTEKKEQKKGGFELMDVLAQAVSDVKAATKNGKPLPRFEQEKEEVRPPPPPGLVDRPV